VTWHYKKECFRTKKETPKAVEKERHGVRKKALATSQSCEVIYRTISISLASNELSEWLVRKNEPIYKL